MSTRTITSIAWSDPSLVYTFNGQLGEANGAKHVPVAKLKADNKWWLATAVGPGTELAGEFGIAITLQQGQVDEYVPLLGSGNVIAEGTFSSGHAYILGGGSPGDMNDDADESTPSWIKTHLFHARSASGTNVQLIVAPVVVGVATA